MRLDEVFGLDIIQFVEAQKHVIVDFLSGELNSLRLSKLGVMAGIINKSMRDASLRKKKIIRDELIATPIEKLYDFDSLRKIEAKVLERFQTEMDRFGIFCTTLNHNSLLMWAHYAQSHQGAVLEFAPDFNRNSVLCASRPVRYSNERPLLYRTPSDMLRHGLTMSAEESAERITKELIFTKSPEWEYEQEFRLAIPNFISVDASFNALDFAPTELNAIYLGCRTCSSDGMELIELARSLNERVQIFQAKISYRKYALEFVNI